MLLSAGCSSKWSYIVRARISHTLSAAARDRATSTSLRSLTVIDILFKYASVPAQGAPLFARSYPRLVMRLATKWRKKRGLDPKN
jgi:hypothetical protein